MIIWRRRIRLFLVAVILMLVSYLGVRFVWSAADAECRAQEKYVPQYVPGNMSYSFYSVCDQFTWQNEWQISQWP